MHSKQISNPNLSANNYGRMFCTLIVQYAMKRNIIIPEKISANVFTRPSWKLLCEEQAVARAIAASDDLSNPGSRARCTGVQRSSLLNAPFILLFHKCTSN